jgi:very-short-patch-repair endonuclease
MNKDKNFAKFLEKTKEIHNDYYTYGNNYSNARTNMTIMCPIHGEFQQRPDNHLQGKGCKLCGIDKLKILFTKSKEQFVNESNIIHNNKYDYSESEYINDSTKLTIICSIHGQFRQSPNDHLHGSGCLKCKGKKFSASMNRKYSKIFIEKARQIHGDKYVYLKENYVAMRKNMKINCKKHGEFEQLPYNHLMGKGCKFCNNSHGETKIENFLIKNNFIFEREKTFENCRNKEKLPFDFYLEKYNLIIEFDGEQHFRPMGYFGGNSKLLYTQQNDIIKNEYCLNNNIRLIRIPFTEVDNVEIILKNELIV